MKPITCQRCGKDFVLAYNTTKKYAAERKYCSRQCRAPPAEERFLAAFEIDPASGCWNWTRGVDQDGYGQFKPMKAHRYSFERAYGGLPAGKMVLHRCDNPSCVNPEHLFLGDVLINAQDCAAKNRTVFGERNQHAKLTDAIVSAIKASDKSGPALAREYGVTRATINKVRRGETWRRVQ